MMPTEKRIWLPYDYLYSDQVFLKLISHGRCNYISELRELQASTSSVLCSWLLPVAGPSGPAHHTLRALSCLISCGDITASTPSPSEAESPSLSPGHGNWRCPLEVANNGMKGWILECNAKINNVYEFLHYLDTQQADDRPLSDIQVEIWHLLVAH